MLTKIKWLFILSLITILNSCGGGGSKTWGIDHNSGKPIPVCDGDRNSTTNAISVNADQTVKKLIDPTVVRIWHYQNGEKKICVVQGKAIIDG